MYLLYRSILYLMYRSILYLFYWSILYSCTDRNCTYFTNRNCTYCTDRNCTRCRSEVTTQQYQTTLRGGSNCHAPKSSLRMVMDSLGWRIEILFLNLSVFKIYYKVKTILISLHVTIVKVFKMKPNVFSRYLSCSNVCLYTSFCIFHVGNSQVCKTLNAVQSIQFKTVFK